MGSTHKSAKRRKAGSRSNKLRNHVLYLAYKNLIQSDGRAAGIKFNKLVYSIYSNFNARRDPKLHFKLPHRWYLYGAVVDSAEVSNLLMFDHEDEKKSNVTWLGEKLLCRGLIRQEIDSECEQFCRKYRRDFFYSEMLRDHYQYAPMQFQKSFLEWNLLASDMSHGSIEISVDELKTRLSALERDYPDDLEPRLTPSFHRLFIHLDGVLSRSAHLGIHEVAVMRDLMWDFWKTFGLFLSVKHRKNISRGRLQGYQARAERELPAYKRRLDAVLESRYLRSKDPISLDDSSLRLFSSLYEHFIIELIGE